MAHRDEGRLDPGRHAGRIGGAGGGLRAGTVCPAISQPGSHGSVVDYDALIETAIGVALAAMVELGEA